MSNYKVKVNNEAESKEIQELLQQLGYNKRSYLLTNERMRNDGYPDDYEIGFLFAEVSGYISCANKTSTTFFTDHRFKEVTIPQLKDLVVLKRNSIDDATHTGEKLPSQKGYLTADGIEYFWNYCFDKWNTLSKLTFACQELKPNEKKEMKEYLKIYDDGSCVLMDGVGYSGQDNWHDVAGADWAYKNSRGKVIAMNGEIGDSFVCDLVWQREKEEVIKEYLAPQDNGKYALTKATEKRVSDWVEVPEGANIYASANDGISTFWGDEYQWTRCGKITRKASEDKSFSFSDWQKTWSAEILWQRHTQPEELPFVDDEPKLNTPMAEIERELKREQCLNNAKNKGLLEARGVEPVVVALSDIKKTFSSEPKSLNNTYAEIEQVRQDDLSIQVGGNHYKNLAIQPVEFAMQNNLDFCQANAIKYIVRHADKNGKEDLLKAKHYIDLLIQHHYSDK